jgi:hypothetical protein
LALIEEARRRGLIGAKQPSRILLSDLKIRTKQRELVPFEPNPIQAKYLDEITPGWRSGDIDLRGRREIILKARQFGFSTLILALLFLETVNTPNTQTVVVAHDADSTERLFRIVKRFYENLPEGKKPPTKYANRREYLWHTLDSYFFVGTAGSGQFGRGGTINLVHGSEVAFWPNPDDLVAGLLEAVPEDGAAFLETTANGVGNWYHQEYLAAQNDDSAFAPRFFAWFEHPEYTKPVDGPLPPAKDEEERERERRLVEVHGCAEGQLAWRREKRKALKEKFPQEYPSTPREAFIVSGAKYFDVEALEALETALTDIHPLSIPAPDTGGVLARHWEKLEVYAVPIAGRQYVVSADTAEGLDEDGNHDYDSADVLDCETWEQVAHFHGQIDTHEYGLLLAELGFWYNTALLGIERNNHGHAVINSALHSGGYPEQKPGEWRGLYMHEEYDETKKAKQRKPGWPTTPKTKYFALDGLATSLETRDIKPQSKATLGELMTFLKLPRGKAGAPPKAHDDRVISLSIGDALLKMRPRKKGWSLT